MDTPKALKNNLGTLEGSIHSAINETINTPKQIKGITKQSSEAVNSSTTQSKRNTTNSTNIISINPSFIPR